MKPRACCSLAELSRNPTEGLVAAPLNDDFFLWEAYLLGPEDSPYEGGLFAAELKFPKDYPLSPPKMRFLCPMWHPNIFPDGTVCISILHAPGDDPMRYESAVERWSPVQSVEKILLSVMSMLAAPNDESPANVDAAKQFRDNMPGFVERVRVTVEQSIGWRR